MVYYKRVKGWFKRSAVRRVGHDSAPLCRSANECFVFTGVAADSADFLRKNRYFRHKSHPSKFEISINEQWMLSVALFIAQFLKSGVMRFLCSKKLAVRGDAVVIPSHGREMGHGIVRYFVFLLKSDFAGTCRSPPPRTPLTQFLG